MRRCCLLVILGLTVGQYSWGQLKADSKEKSNIGYPASDTLPIDSVKHIPRPIGLVNDFVHLFSTAEIETLDSLIGNYEEKTTIEIAVATIDSSMIGPVEFVTYTLQMLRTWGVGKKEKNNGILIVIVPDLRRLRVENGYGIEKFLSNDETAAIIESSFIPYFKEGKFYEGTRQGILAIMEKLAKNGYPSN